MIEVQGVTEVAKGISDLGFMVMATAFFLILSATMMVAMFKWFKSIINGMIEDFRKALETQNEYWKDLHNETQSQNEKLNGVLEGLRPETLLRIRNLTGIAFDLSIEKVCRLIKRVREENHIKDKVATADKIRKSLKVIHSDRNNRFDAFTFKGKPLSEYCEDAWIEEVAKVVESEIYHVDGANNGRAYTNVKLAYDNIRSNFYNKLINN